MRRSVMVSGERSVDGRAGVVVVADRCGERQDALQDPDDDSGGSVDAVSFEVDLRSEGPG
jgi:hypothetical protein